VQQRSIYITTITTTAAAAAAGITTATSCWCSTCQLAAVLQDSAAARLQGS
jgi:hypothetical protein